MGTRSPDAPDIAVILAESRSPGPSQVTYELSMKILSRFPRAVAAAMLVTIPSPRGGDLSTGAGTPANPRGGAVSTGAGTPVDVSA